MALTYDQAVIRSRKRPDGTWKRGGLWAIGCWPYGGTGTAGWTIWFLGADWLEGWVYRGGETGDEIVFDLTASPPVRTPGSRTPAT